MAHVKKSLMNIFFRALCMPVQEAESTKIANDLGFKIEAHGTCDGGKIGASTAG